MRLNRSARGSIPAALLSIAVLTAIPLTAQEEGPPQFRPAPWLGLGVELRSRSETDTGVNFEPDHRHLFTLSRIRLAADVQAPAWLRFHVTLQDARTLAGEDPDIREQNRNELDFLDAYLEAAPDEGSVWRLRIGRQALAFGAEDLVGADEEWSNRGQRFDAIRVTVKPENWTWDLFSGSLVHVLPGKLDEIRYTHRLSGVYGRWESQDAGLEIEPFVFWKFAPQSNESGGTDGWRSEWTPGVSATKELRHGFSLYGEVALQFGQALHQPVHAWATAWELRHPLTRDKHSEIVLGWAHSSGDRQPRDGRRGTFDDLYPAAYNGCGFLVPFAWRNIRDLHAGANGKLTRNLSWNSELHSYWLDSKSDGVYVDEETWVRLGPEADSSRLGAQWDVLLAYRQSRRWNVGIGYAHFFPGPYLQQNAPAAAGQNAFLSWTWIP